jgi:hypothetical protein
MDVIRQKLLRFFLSQNILRYIYMDRAYRLSFLFGLSLIMAFFWSWVSLVGVILLGPILLGVPHLYSSWKASDQSYPTRFRFSLGFVISVTLFLYLVSTRLFSPQVFSEWRFDPLFLILPLALLLLEIISKRPKISGIYVFSAGLLLVIFSGSLYFENITILGLLALGHHFVAFYYWWESASTSQEKRVAIFSGITLAIVSIAIYFGSFDSIILTDASLTRWLPNGLDAGSFGRVFWESQNPMIWNRIALIYGVGQSIHYFVWLKAIPDLKSPNPKGAPSFRVSFEGLRFKNPNWVFYSLIFFLFLFPMMLFFFDPIWVRNLYLMLAAFHGYYEIYGMLRYDLRNT